MERIGQPDWEEELITENEADIEKATAWAQAQGFDRIRIAVMDLSVAPDFGKTISI